MKLIAKTVFIFILLIFPVTAFAFDASGVQYEKVNPGDDYRFVIKRLKEKMKLGFLSFSSEKKSRLLPWAH